MKYTLNNQSKGDETEVYIGSDIAAKLSDLAGTYTKIAVVTDENTAGHWLDNMKKPLGEVAAIILPDGEDNKSLQYVEDILKQLREGGFDRKSLVVGLGGGVISDIAGFAASTYMRGVDWVMIPTTLIAQADASIGGKTGVNLGGYKNMVGSFWPPKAVLINPDLLQTLPLRHLKNGLAEIIKMGFISDKNILGHINKLDPSDPLGEELNQAAELAVKAKVAIVNADLYEKGERKLLNFGHTVGHALESISLETDAPLLHGEAVSIGMMAEARLAELEGVCEPGLAAQIGQLLEKFALPTAYDQAHLKDVLKHIESDKKNVGTNIYWTLPKAAGSGIFDHIASQSNIEQAINSIIK